MLGGESRAVALDAEQSLDRSRPEPFLDLQLDGWNDRQLVLAEPIVGRRRRHAQRFTDQGDELERDPGSLADLAERLIRQGREPFICISVEEVEGQRALLDRHTDRIKRDPCALEGSGQEHPPDVAVGEVTLGARQDPDVKQPVEVGRLDTRSLGSFFACVGGCHWASLPARTVEERACRFFGVGPFLWVGLGILALNVLFLGVLAFISLIRRIQIARTRRELERLGFVVRFASAGETRPIWPRLAAASAGLAALIITTSVITAAAPSAPTEATTAASSLQDGPTHTIAPPSTNPGSEHPASESATVPPDVTGPTTSTTSSPAPPPRDGGSDAGAPSTVAAVPTSATTIHLEWMPVEDADHYAIERSIDSVTWKPVGSTDGGQTTYTDEELSSGTTYYYRIVASVDGQDAPPSDAVSATTTGGTPTSPVLMSATGSVESVELVWSDVDGDLGYRIERSPDGTTGWVGIGTTGQNVTMYTDTGLASATSYSYRVVAVTPDGETPPSTVLSATTDAEAPAISP